MLPFTEQRVYLPWSLLRAGPGTQLSRIPGLPSPFTPTTVCVRGLAGPTLAGCSGALFHQPTAGEEGLLAIHSCPYVERGGQKRTPWCAHTDLRLGQGHLLTTVPVCSPLPRPCVPSSQACGPLGSEPALPRDWSTCTLAALMSPTASVLERTGDPGPATHTWDADPHC